MPAAERAAATGASPKAAGSIASRALAGLAALAGVVCCAIPLLLAAGVVGGAGWALVDHALPAAAIALGAAAAATWWWTSRRKT